MIGDPGPYMNDEGDVWVPRTVPYLQARQIARASEHEYGDRLVYEGKEAAYLFGFTLECWCDEACRLRDPEVAEADGRDEDTCRVAAWHFRWVER